MPGVESAGARPGGPRRYVSRGSRVVGYLCAIGAGATWGTTGPLSTGLYDLMPATSIGFWRILIGMVALGLWGLVFHRDLFRVDRRGWLLIGVGGGLLVALFEVAYQFAIAGAGVAGAAALLYTAPVLVAVLGRLILGEALTPLRLALAVVVMVGVALTVHGGSNAGAEAARLGLTVAVSRRVARAAGSRRRLGARRQLPVLLGGAADRGGPHRRRGDRRAGRGRAPRLDALRPALDRARLARPAAGGGRRGRRLSQRSQAG
ncbi:MAG: hypothetical protein DMD74_03780 [Gemmatimonadetes bacterium]|nr:MAG: hypothetical protein DMD74_03780 [Gemmatimonadota bacterium]